MSAKSKTILALFAMCGKSTVNLLLNEVSKLKNEENEREGRNTNMDQDSLLGDETNASAESASTAETSVTSYAASDVFIGKHRHNFVKMLFGFQFHDKKFTREKKSVSATNNLVQFLFRNDVTSDLSWGSKTLFVDGNTAVIAAKNRLASRHSTRN